MKKILLLALLLAHSFFLNAQESSLRVTVLDSTNNTINHLVDQLVGGGVKIIDVRSNQPKYSEAIGSFTDSDKSFGLSQGIIMTNGSIHYAIGPNIKGNTGNKNRTLGDSLLSSLVEDKKTFDASVIEIDIIPSADTLAFSYVFGSEEYDEYVCSKFNDVFAFFIKGKGINGFRNMALVPNTQIPVTINNVNGGNAKKETCAPNNATFYIRNDSTTANPNLEYDGFTRVIEVKQSVIAGETYTLKLAIADVSDNLLDSGVFIEGKSLISYFQTEIVYFNYDKSGIKSDEYPHLAKLVKFIKEKGINKIEVSGHTDNKGEDKYNQALSKRRVNSVVRYLISKGVKRSNISIQIRGEKMPVHTNETEEGKAKNRRVEIRLIGA